VVATLEFGQNKKIWSPYGEEKEMRDTECPFALLFLYGFSTRTRLKRKDIFFLTILFQTRSSPIENIMKILARAVGRRKEAVAQVQLVPGTGQFIINNPPVGLLRRTKKLSLRDPTGNSYFRPNPCGEIRSSTVFTFRSSALWSISKGFTMLSSLRWASDGLAELTKIPGFVRGKVKRNTEKYAVIIKTNSSSAEPR
jgi:hypothetical protein